MIKNNIDKLLILEDTCKFVSDFSESYNKILRQSKSLKYDILIHNNIRHVKLKYCWNHINIHLYMYIYIYIK